MSWLRFHGDSYLNRIRNLEILSVSLTTGIAEYEMNVTNCTKWVDLTYLLREVQTRNFEVRFSVMWVRFHDDSYLDRLTIYRFSQSISGFDYDWLGYIHFKICWAARDASNGHSWRRILGLSEEEVCFGNGECHRFIGHRYFGRRMIYLLIDFETK